MLFSGITLNQDVFELWNNEYKEFFFFVEKAASFTCLVGSVLNGIFQLKSQSRIFIKSLFRLETETLTLFTTEKREVSSANSLTSVLRP